MNNVWSEIERLNPWWQGDAKPFEGLLSRPVYIGSLLNHPLKQIDILIGARRVGKTYLLKQLIQHYLKTIPPRSMLYLTAELPILQQASLEEILIQFRDAAPKHQPRYVFIDEIQELALWQTTLKYFVDTDQIKFFVTGSSSLILNQQTSKLTGRYLITKVLPLSFAEYLTFKRIGTNQAHDFVIPYLETGGYPEYVLEGNTELLTQTTESILYRDLLSLHGIRNPAFLKTLLNLLCDKVTTPLSSHTIAKQHKVDATTVQSYLQYLQDVYLIYPLFRQGRSHRVVKGSTPKYYLNDMGILRLFSQTVRLGHLAENAVFLHLLRQTTGEQQLHYDVVEDQEIDFIFQDKSYEVKTKPIENPNPEITYVVLEVDPTIDARQIPMERMLLS